MVSTHPEALASWYHSEQHGTSQIIWTYQTNAHLVLSCVHVHFVQDSGCPEDNSSFKNGVDGFYAFCDPRKTHVQEGNGESTGGVLSQGYPILSSSWPWLSDTGDPRGAHIEPRLSSGQRLLEVQDQSRRLRERWGLWLGLPGEKKRWLYYTYETL